MTNKDKRLQKLFDDYTDQYQPDISVITKAKSHMVEKNTTKNKVAKWLKRLAPTFACVVLALFIVLYSAGVFPIKNDDQVIGEDSSITDSIVTTTYTDDDLKRTTINFESANNLFDIDWIGASTIVEEKYYAYYFKDDDSLALVYASLRININSTYVDVDLFLTNSNKQYDKLINFKEIKQQTKINGTLVNNQTNLVDGEYVNQAYIKNNNISYCLQTSSPNSRANEEVIKKIINNF